MRRLVARLLAALLVGCAGTAAAEPGYYVVTVYGDPGVRSADFRYWSVKSPGSRAVIWPELGLGWNVDGRWYTELYASYVGSSEMSLRLDTLNWQNDFLLTQGQYPFDLAIHTQLLRPQHPAAGHLLEFGPALQTDFGRTQVNLNLFFERGFGAQSAQPTELKYQWQLRHRWQRWLHVGAQGFGELGPWDDWSPRNSQSHRAGPALFGSLPVGPGTIGWQAAWLLGKTYGHRGSMFTMRVKYDF
ncbi:MAG: hypothetical protein ABI699_03440 [Caldimonas sp.]